MAPRIRVDELMARWRAGSHDEPPSWDDVIAASFLRTHAPRIVVAAPQLARRVLDKADLDMGVAGRGGGDVEVLRPAGGRWLCRSWQRWVIAEHTYAEWLAARAGTGGGPEAAA